jgi:hypothetical protein
VLSVAKRGRGEGHIGSQRIAKRISEWSRQQPPGGSKPPGGFLPLLQRLEVSASRLTGKSWQMVESLEALGAGGPCEADVAAEPKLTIQHCSSWARAGLQVTQALVLLRISLSRPQSRVESQPSIRIHGCRLALWPHRPSDRPRASGSPRHERPPGTWPIRC